jgi:hypothetical protein
VARLVLLLLRDGAAAGFTLADFLPDRVVLRFFKWDQQTQSPDAIDGLEPFHTVDLVRPA